jgi:kanamycin kinase
LAEKFADWRWEVVSEYPRASVTYRLSHDEKDGRFLKLSVPDRYPSVEEEAARLRWAAINHLPVPQVLEQGSDDGMSWLLTAALRGVDATDSSLVANPSELVPILASGLRLLHAVPASSCPFDFGLDRALEHVRERVARHLVDADRDFHSEFAHLQPSTALDLLEAERPRSEDVVVCHGDYCLPNVIVRDGRASGFVDLGELGTADRWWDLAVATWSVTWNLGAGYEELFLSAYGVAIDAERMRYYRLLYDMTC